MRIVWHGHSCFEICGEDVTVVVDPHDGKSLGIKPPSVSANVVLVTHGHNDHSSVKAVRGNHIDFIETVGKFFHSGVEMEGFQVGHDTAENRFGPNVMYRIHMDGMTVCHCGDIGAIPDGDVMDSIRGTDILIVPAGEVNTLCIDSLFEFIRQVSPKVVIPMHYHVCGLSLPLRSLDRFLEYADPVDYVGYEMDISSDELPQEREYWVFSR